MAALLEGMAEGSVEACALEYARTKLLLGPAPRNINKRCEFARRLERWKEGAYQELLIFAENQHRVISKARHTKGKRPKLASRARRARALVSEGAYSKAAASLHTEMAELDEQDQMEWGKKLLPCSIRPELAHVVVGDPLETEESQSGYALAGVHFRAMSAPGPSGATPEHLREFVAARDRRIASRLTRAIAKLVDVASTGQLCAEGRWILDSRLV